MRNLLRPLMLLLLAAAPCAVAAELRPGDQVRLIERDPHIPAHPAPGESRVHLRLVSGSEASVLEVNAATGGLEVRGEPLHGPENTGWITPRYLASQQGEVATGARGVPAWAISSPCHNHTDPKNGIDRTNQPPYNRAHRPSSSHLSLS